MTYTSRENPANLSPPLLSHLKYREIHKVNHEHFSRQFTPLSNGHYHFVETPRPHVFVSIFYLLLLLAVLCALLSSFYIRDEPLVGGKGVRPVRTSKIMSKVKTADRKAANARLLARRKRRAVDFRPSKTLIKGAEADGKTLVFVERITVMEDAMVDGGDLEIDFSTPPEPSSADEAMNSSDHGLDSESDTERAVQLTNKPDDGDRSQSSIYKTDDVPSPEESGEDKIADISAETKETMLEAGSNNDNKLNTEPSSKSIRVSAAESTDVNHANEVIKPEGDMQPSPSETDSIISPLINTTENLENADPGSDDKQEIDPKSRTTGVTSTQENSPPPRVSLEHDNGTVADTSAEVEDTPVTSGNAAPAIVDASAMLPPPLPGRLYTRERSPQRKFVGLQIDPPQADLGIEAVPNAAVASAFSEPTEDEGSTSEGTAVDGTSVSESDTLNTEISNPAASEAEVEVLRGKESADRRSTVGAIPETTSTKDTDGVPESNRRSMGATRSGRSTLRYSFNSIPHSAHTPDWNNQISWTLAQMQKRKDSQEVGRGEPENDVPEVPETRTPTSAPRIFDHMKDSPILSLRERMARRSIATNTVLPSPSFVGQRMETLSGQRPNILGDSPRTGSAASPFSAAGLSTGFRNPFKQATSTPRSAYRPSNLRPRSQEGPSSPNDEVAPDDKAQ